MKFVSSIKTSTIDWAGFFFIGLANNFTYIVFLSASEDLVHNSGLVLFCSIFPSLLATLVVPYVQRLLSYKYLVCFVVSTFISSLLIVSLSKLLVLKLLGVAIASFGSGTGESIFLAISTFYKTDVLSGWCSGTGGAGIVGSFYYLFMTTVLRFEPEETMMLSLLFPAVMLICYFFVVSHPDLSTEKAVLGKNESPSVIQNQTVVRDQETDNKSALNSKNVASADEKTEYLSFRRKLRLVKPLLLRYMLPLLVIYWAQYTINQGISPVIVYERDQTPLSKTRDQYVYYQFLYRMGVFISKTSVAFLKIDQFWIASVLQVVILVVLLMRSLLVYSIPIYLVFAMIFIEGLFAGICYANAFRVLSKRIHPSKREFSISTVAVAVSLGITLASIGAIFIKPAICNYQVTKGVVLCRPRS